LAIVSVRADRLEVLPLSVCTLAARVEVVRELLLEETSAISQVRLTLLQSGDDWQHQHWLIQRNY
jgi:hypothetical protein